MAGGTKSIAVLIGAAVLLLLVTVIAPPVSANHWCAPATVTAAPASGYVGETKQFSFRLTNNVPDDLTVYHFNVTYGWSGTIWDLGTATVPGNGGSHTFYQTQLLPSTAGSYGITISVEGQAGITDLFSSTCPFPAANFDVLPYTPPTVVASANPNTGTPPLNVTFSASVSNGLGPFSYSWSFGDGANGIGASPRHTYASVGMYTARVIVTDSRSNSGAGMTSVSVTPSVPPLIGTIGADVASGNVPLAVSFTANATGGVSPYTYLWSFGDGGSSTLQNPAHTFQRAANYTVSVTITDVQGRNVTKSTRISGTAPSSNPGPNNPTGMPAWVTYAIIAALFIVGGSLALWVFLRTREKPAPDPPPPPASPPATETGHRWGQYLRSDRPETKKWRGGGAGKP